MIEISNINASIIIFESAKRINGTLMALKEILGNRKVAICRELTKKFEEIINGNISDVLKEISSRDSLKGEIVIVVSGPRSPMKKILISS